MPEQPQTRQKAKAGRDAYIAGRDVIINDGVGTTEHGVPGLLPRDVPGFTGREEELARLAGLAAERRVVVSAIGGTAGVGKTALAVHAAYQLLKQFPDGHLYTDLRGFTEGQDPAEPNKVLEMFLRSLGVPAEAIPATVEERSGLLRQVLADQRVLMLLDNARTEAQVRPLLPGAGRSLVLVTSRSVLPGLEVDERISLDILPENEAAAMLAGVIGTVRTAAEPQAVAEVARLCGRLPLALRIAGQLLAAHPTWPVGRLAGTLAGKQDRLARLGAGDLQVRATFEVSYQQLAEEDARLFRLLGLHPGPDLTTAAAAALTGMEPRAAASVLDRLTEAHLVNEEAPGRFVMHDLLRLYALTTCQETDNQSDRESAETSLVGYYVDLAESLDSWVNPELRSAAAQAAEQAGIPLLSIRQALAVFQAERPSLLAAIGLAAQRDWDDQVLQLSESTAGPLGILCYPDDLLTIQKAALAAARHTGDTADQGARLNGLGNAYGQSRRFEEAIASYQQALAILREIGDRNGEGITLSNLGYAYQEVRRFEEAITSHQQALAILRETGDRCGAGQTLNKLGLAYQEAQRSEEAITNYQQALAILRETGDRHSEGQTLNNLGIAYQDLRRFEEAIASHQQALTIGREIGDRHGEGIALNNLGNDYGNLRRFEEAIASHQQALTIGRETGDRHSEGIALNSLGNAYQDLRRFEEAISCFQQDISICRETGDRYGEGHTLDNLGSAYHEMRQLDQAAACWREAAAAMRDADDHEQAACLEQMAANARSRRRWWPRRRSSS